MNSGLKSAIDAMSDEDRKTMNEIQSACDNMSHEDREILRQGVANGLKKVGKKSFNVLTPQELEIVKNEMQATSDAFQEAKINRFLLKK